MATPTAWARFTSCRPSVGTGDGWNPRANLILDAARNLYGTTYQGGTGTNPDGTVFELTPAGGGAWTETILYTFTSGADGENPNCGLIFDSSGNLYGTTVVGGSGGGGTAFEITP